MCGRHLPEAGYSVRPESRLECWTACPLSRDWPYVCSQHMAVICGVWGEVGFTHTSDPTRLAAFMDGPMSILHVTASHNQFANDCCQAIHNVPCFPCHYSSHPKTGSDTSSPTDGKCVSHYRYTLVQTVRSG